MINENDEQMKGEQQNEQSMDIEEQGLIRPQASISDPQKSNEDEIIKDERFRKQICMFNKNKYDQSMLQQLSNCVNSIDIIKQHRGVIGFRKILNTIMNVSQQTKEFIDRRIVSKLLWLASQNQYPQLRFYSCFILANIASWEVEYCKKIIEMGYLQIFRKLLEEKDQSLIQLALFGLGNLATETQYRDLILNNGSLNLLNQIAEASEPIQIVRVVCWVTSNLCRGQPNINKKYVHLGCTILCKGILRLFKEINENSQQHISDSLFAIAKMMQIDNKTVIKVINEHDLLPFFFQIFQVKSLGLSVKIPSLRILGNFSIQKQIETDYLIKHGIFDLAIKILDFSRKLMRKQMCWILSNIAASPKPQVQMFLSRTDLLDKICHLFNTDDIDIIMQINWIYGNLVMNSEKNEFLKMIKKYQIMKTYAYILSTVDENFLLDLLTNMKKILILNKRVQEEQKKVLKQQFKASNGVQILQKLLESTNNSVHQKIIEILNILK